MIGKKINQLATELAPASTDLTIIGNPTTGVSKKITLAQLGAIFSGAVSFYTNYASFPATGTTDVIFCAKDTQKLYLWSGSAYVEVFPSQALLDTYQLRSEKGNANGYASLDSQGKVPISQLPSSIMEYKGTWSAATNTPTLANGTGDTGDVYICNAAGTVNFGAGPITFAVGDYVIYSGTIWQRSSGAVGTVTSVAVSRSGDALAITGSPVTTSGTINVGFAGNSTQYINGAGNLVTFPGVINEAQNLITEVYNKTGATLTKGTVVYINGGQGNLPAVTKALATGDNTSAQTYGIVRNDITNNNNGYVVVAGRISDLDTQAFTEGTQLYLSSTTAGTYTSTKQYAPNHLVYVGIVVRAHPTQGVIEVKIQNGYEMDELHNVAAQTPSNNDGLFWEASTSLWKNKSIATILGYTPADDSLVVHKAGTETITGAKTFTSGIVVSNSGIQISGSTSDWLNVEAAGEKVYYGTSFIRAWDKQSGGSRIISLRPSGLTTGNDYVVSFPAKSGTIAFTDDLSGGTVTSVGLSSATSGVTIGSTPITTSGTITLAIATASGSQQGLLSSTDWTTFNNKQNALTNPVTGTGTTNYLPKFTGASTIGDSAIFDNSGNILIGATTNSEGAKLKIAGGYVYLKETGGADVYLRSAYDTNKAAIQVASASDLVFVTSNTTRLTLNSSGNLGLGVTPSAWNSTLRVIEIGGPENGYIAFNPTNLQSYIYWNAYYDTDNRYKKSSQNAAAFGFTASGSYAWYNAPSGTAGNAISFTQAMTLNASGNLSIGNTNDTYKLDVTGTGNFTGALTGTSGSFSANISGLRLVLNTTAAYSSSGTLGYNSNDGNYIWAKAGTSSNFTILNDSGSSVLTLASTGAATFSSSVAATDISVASSNFDIIKWQKTSGTASNVFSLSADSGGAYIQDVTNTKTLLYLAENTGAATFSNSITTNSGGVIIGTGSGSNWQVYKDPSTSFLGMYLSGASPFMVINSSGNVGIGTTSPTSMLTLNGTSPFIRIERSGVNTWQIQNNYLVNQNGFSINNITAGSTPFFIGENGNVGVGTASPNVYSGFTNLQVNNSSGNGLVQVTGSSATVGSFYAGGGQGQIGTSSAHPFVLFTADVERMRITSGGNLLANKTVTGQILTNGFEFNPTDNYLSICNSTSANYSLYVANTGTSGTRNMVAFYGTSSLVGSITYNGTITAYNITSDYRLKTDFKDYNGLNLVNKIKTYDYEWKADKSRGYGVIAHELQSVINYAVTGEKDGKEMQQVDYSKIVPVLIKAIQEQQTQIEQLKNK